MVEIDKNRGSHEHVKYGYPRQVAHETACACLQLRPASPKLQPTDAASGNDDTVSNHMMKEKLGKYGGKHLSIWTFLNRSSCNLIGSVNL